MAEKTIEALILDLDGVVISRPPYQVKATADYKKVGLKIYEPPQNLPRLDELTRGKHLNPSDAASFTGHLLRWVYPDVAKTLPQVNEVPIFGNTGRFDHPAWIGMTKLWLRLGGLPSDVFEDIHFKPKGMRSTDSKIIYEAELLKRYKRIRLLDDNPADLLPALRTFGDRAEGVLVADRSTDFLMANVDLADYPTLRIVSRFRDGIQDL